MNIFYPSSYALSCGIFFKEFKRLFTVLQEGGEAGGVAGGKNEGEDHEQVKRHVTRHLVKLLIHREHLLKEESNRLYSLKTTM